MNNSYINESWGQILQRKRLKNLAVTLTAL